eukprot:4769973-Heterocapsa_arctica.AAC.1
MNKTFCSSYTHKIWKYIGNNFPVHQVRIEASNIMVGNHEDKIFQQQEEKEANRLRTSRTNHHTKDKEELDQLHNYVHA